MGLIKTLVATYKFAKAGGDWNTGEIRQKPAKGDAAKADAAKEQPEAKKPEGWTANDAPAGGEWRRK